MSAPLTAEEYAARKIRAAWAAGVRVDLAAIAEASALTQRDVVELHQRMLEKRKGRPAAKPQPAPAPERVDVLTEQLEEWAAHGRPRIRRLAARAQSTIQTLLREVEAQAHLAEVEAKREELRAQLRELDKQTKRIRIEPCPGCGLTFDSRGLTAHMRGCKQVPNE